MGSTPTIEIYTKLKRQGLQPSLIVYTDSTLFINMFGVFFLWQGAVLAVQCLWLWKLPSSWKRVSVVLSSYQTLWGTTCKIVSFHFCLPYGFPSHSAIHGREYGLQNFGSVSYSCIIFKTVRKLSLDLPIRKQKVIWFLQYSHKCLWLCNSVDIRYLSCWSISLA